MADEILDTNVIRVMRDGSRWCALIGPDPQRGLVAFGYSPFEAIERVVLRAWRLGWVWDETWKPS